MLCRKRSVRIGGRMNQERSGMLCFVYERDGAPEDASLWFGAKERRVFLYCLTAWPGTPRRRAADQQALEVRTSHQDLQDWL